MKNLGLKLNHFFSSNLIFFMLAAMLLGWGKSEYFSQYRNWVPWMFGFMTLVTSLKTSWRDLGGIFSKPLPLITIIIFQHALFPFIAQFIGKIGFPDNPHLIAGFILTAALPVGITAVIWTGMSKGDVALSLTAATLDTLLSPITVSLVLYMFVGKSMAINYQAMMTALVVMIVIPSVVGLTINDLSGGKFYSRSEHLLGPLSSIALCGVIVVNVATAQATASTLISAAPSLIFLAFALVASGFFTGWLFPKIFGFSKEASIACVYCTGIRNTSCGLVIAMGHLPVEASIPLLVAMFFQQPISALFQRNFLKKLAPAPSLNAL